jgi:phage tail-like protein
VDFPLLASRFLVEVGDRAVPVSEVRGLAYAPGLEPAATVTLRRAAGIDRTLLDWALEPKERPVRVTLFGQTGEAVVSYVLEGARPTAWHGPDLDAASPEIAWEELVLAVDRIDLR